MAIEHHPISDRADWLKLRERDVTASAVGCLLGIHDYYTAFQLWALKTRRIAEDPEETAPMRRGRLLEPVAIELLREEAPTWRIENPKVYLRDIDARLGATPDIFAEDPENGFGIVQIKTVEPGIFARKWRDPETREVMPPLWIAVQAITEAHLAGAKWAAVGAMTVGFGVEMHIVPVPIHQGVVDRVRAVVADFWAMIDAGQQPDPDYARDGETIARMFDEDVGTELDLSHDQAFADLVGRRAALKQGIKLADADADVIDNEVKARLGNHATALIAGGKRVTWKVQHRKGFTVAPTSYRALRYPRADREAAE